MNRRTFIGSSVAGNSRCKTSGPPLFPSKSRYRRSAYTVRDAMKSDFEGTIAKVASIATRSRIRRLRSITPPKTFAHLDNKRPHRASLPRSLLHCRNDVAPGSRRRYTIGHKLIVNPWIERSSGLRRRLKRAAELSTKPAKPPRKPASVRLPQSHVRISAREVSRRQAPLTTISRTATKISSIMEIDLCWISVAGKDPISYFNNNPGRFPPFHVKGHQALPVPKTHPLPARQTMGFLTEVAAASFPERHFR